MSTPNVVDACLNAMLKHRRGYHDASPNRDATKSHRSQSVRPADPDCSPLSFAKKFSLEVCRVLSPSEVQPLQQFLSAEPGQNRPSTPLTEKELNEHLETFFKADLERLSGSRSELATPSGPLDAEIGIVLHQQTRDGDDVVLHPFAEPHPFWDEESPTIQVLQRKGFGKSVFGFDWHWRAERTMHGRGTCSAKEWEPSRRTLHDEMSSFLVDRLALRFLLIGGACARKSYLERPRTTSDAVFERHVFVPIQPGQSLEFRLEFSFQSLKRIVVFTPHPSAIYFTPDADSSTTPYPLEIAGNFILWLFAQPHDQSSVRNDLRNRNHRPRGLAPFATLSRYIEQEKDLGRLLTAQDYYADFRSWARYFLKDTYLSVISSQRSIAGACREEMNRRVNSGKEATYYSKAPESEGVGVDYKEHCSQKNRDINHRRWGNVQRDLWHGHRVKVAANGTVRISQSKSKKALFFRASPAAFKYCRANDCKPTIHFAPDRVRLMDGDNTVYFRTRLSLWHDKRGKVAKQHLEWIEHMDQELAALSHSIR